jgi:basic membrane protein A
LLICIVAVVALVGGGLVAGCAKKTAPAKPAEEGPKKEVRKIAMIFPGQINDAGWNANGYKGLMKLKEAGYETTYSESVTVPAAAEMIQNYASQGYDLIIGHGFEFADSMIKVARQFPKNYFFNFSKPPANAEIPPNVAFVDQKEYEAAYLCGMLAALVSKSGKIGYVGGMEIPPQLADLAAYTTGARAVKPDIKVLGVITGTFEDPAKGKEAALAQIDNGADVIMHTADSTGMGVVEACKQKRVLLIGYGGDQHELAPDLMLTSLIVNIPEVIVKQVELIKQGKFGGVWKAGIAEGVTDIAPYHQMESKIPQEVRDKIAQARQDIISGKLVVPEIHERIDR